ncbi:MAG: TetR/AcrR family transcriptional regulator [Eubacteriales bacterium]|nr:TetR/AcrR family transcriptional regulator [Eubacteriales bacterium]
MPQKYDSSGRRKKSQETKVKLYNAAIKLFNRYGYENVTISQITDKVGVGKGTFYIHYPSKEAIIVEQFEKIDRFYLERYNNSDKNNNAKSQLMAFLNSVAVLTEDVLKIDSVKVVYRSQINATGNFKLLIDEKRLYFRIIQEIIENGQSKKEFSEDLSSKEITMHVTRFVRAIIYDWILHDGSFSLTAEFDKSFNLFLETIKN